MEKELSKEEVEAELADHSVNMTRRIESMEDEMTSIFSDVQQWFAQNPLASLGGALAVGLLVGYVFKGRRTRSSELSRLQEQLVGHYLTALEGRIERGMHNGLSEREAIQEALDEGVPLIIYQSEAASDDDGGTIGSSVAFMLKTAFGFMLRGLADELVTNLVAGAQKGRGEAPRPQAE